MTTKDFVNEKVQEELIEEYETIPLNISDLLAVCQEYTKLGWQIQAQVHAILDMGVDDSIKSGKVKKESLLLIKSFLNTICKNAYFGEAIDQAKECIFLIDLYMESLQQIKNNKTLN